jgi:putative transposase
VLDGYSRSIVRWDLRESLKEAEIEMILERVKEKYPEANPKIISDEGPVRLPGLQGVHSHLPDDPRAHLSVLPAVRPLAPADLGGCGCLIQSYVDRYNTMRLHSAIGYATPQDMLAGRQAESHAARDRKLEQVRRQRQVRRHQQRPRCLPGPALSVQ